MATIVSYKSPVWKPLAEALYDTDGVRVDLTIAHISDGAACLDGSVPAMYYRAGSGDGVHKFHVFFEGGGWYEHTLSQYMDSLLPLHVAAPIVIKVWWHFYSAVFLSEHLRRSIEITHWFQQRLSECIRL